jgi:feruloyl-CoA synthase
MRSPIVHVPGSAKYRPLRFGVTRAQLRDGADGVRYLRGVGELQPYAQRMTDRLVHWA